MYRTQMDIHLKKCAWGYLNTNMFMLQTGNNILVIDPVSDLSMLKSCCFADSVTVLLTHEHFDHITGLNELRSMVCCRVIASEVCSERIQNARTNMSAYADVLAELAGKPLKETIEPFVCSQADVVFKDEFSFDWMDYRVKVIATPGHSAGSSCILINDMLFVGDTILNNNLMTRFPGSNKKDYLEITVRKLKELIPVASKIFPGHGVVMSRDEALETIRKMDFMGRDY